MHRYAVPRQSLHVAIVGLSIMLGMATPSSGQAFINPFIGSNFGAETGCPEITQCEERNLNLGVAVGNLGNIMGAEFEFSYTSDFFGERPGFSSSVLTLMGNVLLAPRFGPIQPFGLAGLGLIKTDAELSITDLLDSNNNQFGFNVGFGVAGFFGEHVGVRGDIRYYRSFDDLEGLAGVFRGPVDFGRGSVGVVFRF
jgi:opacity protein-like surface antigen